MIAIVAACSHGDKQPAGAATKAHEMEPSAAGGRNEPTAGGSERPAKWQCDAFDRGAVAKAMGWREIENIGGSEPCPSDWQFCTATSWQRIIRTARGLV